VDELRRVCAPGTLAVSVPRAGPGASLLGARTSTTKVEGGHVRIFDREELRAAIERRGFRRVDGHFAHALHAPLLVAQVSLAQARRTGRAAAPASGPTTASSSGTSWNRRGRSACSRRRSIPYSAKASSTTSSWRGDREQPVVGGVAGRVGARARGGLHRARAAIGRLILWYPDGPADPWDHVEKRDGALRRRPPRGRSPRAYRWVADAQHDDGALWATYGEPDDDGDDGSTPVTSRAKRLTAAPTSPSAPGTTISVPRIGSSSRTSGRPSGTPSSSRATSRPDRRGLLDRRGRRRGLRGRAALQLRLDLQESGLRRGRGRRTRSRGAPRSVARGPNPPRRGDPLAARPVRPHLGEQVPVRDGLVLPPSSVAR